MNAVSEQIFLLNPPETQQTNVLQKLDIHVAAPVNLENVWSLSNVCRVCAVVTEYMIPIFSGEGLQNNLADKINKHLPIQVSLKDALPLWLCYQCSCTLLAWHELTVCCVQADQALRTRLAHLTAAQESQVQEQQAPATAAPPPEPEPRPEPERQNEDTKDKQQCGASPPPPPAYPSSPSIACTYCPMQLTHTDAYKQHLVDTHSHLLFHCEECDTYVARKDFILHMSVHADMYEQQSQNNNDEKEKEEAEQLNKEKTKNDKNSEFSDHSDTDDFGPLPDSVFEAIEDSQDEQPNTSENTSTDQSPNKTVASPVKKKKHKITRTCPICAKVYNASSSYFYHMRYCHNNTKEHECDTCGKKYSTKANLVAHLNTHSKEFEFECKQCHKKFRSKPSLYIHEQTHNGVKKYACGECGTSFRWRTHLKRHQKRHAAARTHVCTICARGFSVRCDLLRHARTHSAGEHACDKCGAKFAQLRYLKVHVDKKHSINGAVTSDNQSQSIPGTS